MSPALLETTSHPETSAITIITESVRGSDAGQIYSQDVVRLRQAIDSFHKRLSSLTSIEPCRKTNALFDELVDFVASNGHLDDQVQKALQIERYAKLCRECRQICAKGESLLELHWSKRIIAGKAQLSDFPYHTNYQQLTRLEYHLLCGQGARPQHVLFIGCGPLPLSSLIMASQHLASDWPNGDWSITNVDISSDAVKLATTVSTGCTSQHSTRMSFMCCDAAKLDETLTGTYDAIFLAALVGLEGTDKEDIIRHLSKGMSKNSRLLIRSAEGLRQILYPQTTQQVIVEAGEGRLEVEVICHPRNEVINSVIIARRV